MIDASPINRHRRRVESLRRVRSWAPVFGGVELRRLEGFDLAVVDAVAGVDGVTSTSPAEVRELQERGVLVLAYLSLGTVEEWRHYASSVPSEWTLGPVPGWEGELYVDRRRGWRQLILAEARSLGRAGFDGLLLDNLDVGEEFRETQAGLVELVQGLRAEAPALLLVAQNGLAVAESLPIDAIAHEDVFWRFEHGHGYRRSPREETAVLLAGLRALHDRGLPVFTLDYTEPGSPGAHEAIARSLAEGFCPTVSVLELDRLPHAIPGVVK